ncbi:MAG: transposase [Candidatus Aminicenantes bacterium]|nr:transposase [Candidatus Aminicenantes bacterium]
MKFDPEKHHRRSVRLKKYDYTGGNVYFVTICAYQKECLLGAIIDGRMNLNTEGECVKKAWLETAEKKTNIRLDDFVIMPNHFHGILWIKCRGTASRTPNFETNLSIHALGFRPKNSKWAQHAVPLRDGSTLKPDYAPTEMFESRPEGTARYAPKYEQFGKPVRGSLPTIIRSFKSAATKLINEGRNTPGAPAWQRSYYEHIIRSHKELQQTIEYIRSNPGRWADDEENPANQ